MKFEKKLIIMSGSGSKKGTATLERNAYGSFITLNIFNIPDLAGGEYAFAVKTGDAVYIRKLGAEGRIFTRFQTENFAFDSIHAILFDTLTETPVLYGTYGAKKLWEANIMDGIRRKKLEFTAKENAEKAMQALPEFSGKTETVTKSQEIDNYFMDILGSDAAGYRDGALAEVNYYPEEYRLEVSYSDKESAPRLDKPLPSELESAYLTRYRRNTQSAKDGIAASPADADNIKLAASPEDSGNRYVTEDSESRYDPEENSRRYIQDVKPEPYYDAEPEAVINTRKSSEPDAVINANKNSEPASMEAAATVPPVSGYSPERANGLTAKDAMFYEEIRPQLEDLFKKGEPFTLLSALLPDTSWIKIDYDKNGRYYVVGLIGKRPDYICYGVPAKYTKEPPKELDGYCGWLPLEPSKPDGEGFWLMFQDAFTGESVSGADII